MRQKDLELLNFLFKIIEAQITDYDRLARAGVGPDARLIARLTSDEVNVYLGHVDTLLKQASPAGIDPDTYDTIFSQVKFYAGLEYLRGRAGYLVDDNNIHNLTYQRAEAQFKKLETLEDGKRKLQPFKAVTIEQKQHEHDSHEIAYLVIHSALTLARNPSAELAAKTAFGHGLDRMRKHADPGGRYHQKAVRAKIEEMHENCELFLKESRLMKSARALKPEEARQKKLNDQKTLADLQARFDRLKHRPAKQSLPSSRCTSAFFFKVTATLAVVGVSAFMARTLGNN